LTGRVNGCWSDRDGDGDGDGDGEGGRECTVDAGVRTGGLSAIDSLLVGEEASEGGNGTGGVDIIDGNGNLNESRMAVSGEIKVGPVVHDGFQLSQGRSTGVQTGVQSSDPPTTCLLRKSGQSVSPTASIQMGPVDSQ
jgi:hypothetical protein